MGHEQAPERDSESLYPSAAAPNRQGSEHQEGKKHLSVPAGTRKVMCIDAKEVRGKPLLPTEGQLRYLGYFGSPESFFQTPDCQLQ